MSWGHCIAVLQKNNCPSSFWSWIAPASSAKGNSQAPSTSAEICKCSYWKSRYKLRQLPLYLQNTAHGNYYWYEMGRSRRTWAFSLEAHWIARYIVILLPPSCPWQRRLRATVSQAILFQGSAKRNFYEEGRRGSTFHSQLPLLGPSLSILSDAVKSRRADGRLPGLSVQF